MSHIAYLLDTNSCIYLLARTRPRLEMRVSACEPGSVGVSAIVGAELVLGVSQASDELKMLLERFLQVFPVSSFDETAARAYARVPFRRGKLDRLIAAHALALDATLVTNNVRDFSDVPELKLENWAG
ncbi:MAG TPA: type II toxin-antitoxin system VapC family toxin [Allosphingosinicella sp.]|jgi:tRNA(fMet)-specific endonuclease VapC|nr:type II toxin-antitoxin system VapC family toxin [Allosphingosinicella sp.]